LVPLAEMTESEKQEFFLVLEAEVASLIPPGPSGMAHFALLVFDEGGPPRYVGNLGRSDAARAFREAADRIDKEAVSFDSGFMPGPPPPEQTPIPRSPIPSGSPAAGVAGREKPEVA
jgi:hypothetical protein